MSNKVLEYLFYFVKSMFSWQYFVIPAFGTLLALLICYIKNRKDKTKIIDDLPLVILTGYTALVYLKCVILRPQNDLLLYNLTPFWSYIEAINGTKVLILQNILNVMMTIPVGFLVSLYKKKIKAYTILLIGTCFSLAIEISQLLMKKGLFEFDDIFHNILGAVIGYLFFELSYFVLTRIHAYLDEDEENYEDDFPKS